MENKQETLKNEQHAEIKKQSNEKLKQKFVGTKINVRNNKSKRMFSETFMSFIKPRIDLIRDDEEQVKKILEWGTVVWNKVVANDFPEHPQSEKINLLFPFIYATSSNKDLLNNFIHRKKSEFGDDNFFIIHFETQFDKNKNMSISVAVLQIEK